MIDTQILSLTAKTPSILIIKFKSKNIMSDVRLLKADCCLIRYADMGNKKVHWQEESGAEGYKDYL